MYSRSHFTLWDCKLICELYLIALSSLPLHLPINFSRRKCLKFKKKNEISNVTTGLAGAISSLLTWLISYESKNIYYSSEDTSQLQLVQCISSINTMKSKRIELKSICVKDNYITKIIPSYWQSIKIITTTMRNLIDFVKVNLLF